MAPVRSLRTAVSHTFASLARLSKDMLSKDVPPAQSVVLWQSKQKCSIRPQRACASSLSAACAGAPDTAAIPAATHASLMEFTRSIAIPTLFGLLDSPRRA
jgi:hypothetical protein